MCFSATFTLCSVSLEDVELESLACFLDFLELCLRLSCRLSTRSSGLGVTENIKQQGPQRGSRKLEF